MRRTFKEDRYIVLPLKGYGMDCDNQKNSY